MLYTVVCYYIKLYKGFGGREVPGGIGGRGVSGGPGAGGGRADFWLFLKSLSCIGSSGRLVGRIPSSFVQIRGNLSPCVQQKGIQSDIGPFNCYIEPFKGLHSPFKGLIGRYCALFYVIYIYICIYIYI